MIDSTGFLDPIYFPPDHLRETPSALHTKVVYQQVLKPVGTAPKKAVAGFPEPSANNRQYSLV